MGGWRRLTAWSEPPLRQGALILILLITLFLHQPLLTGRILTATDVLYQVDPLWQPLAPTGFTTPANGLLSDQALLFYPWQAYARAALAQGHSALWDPPLWNPYVNSGHPFLGNLQSALYDPLHLVSLFAPFPASLGVLAWLRLFVAGFFMLWLALELGLSRRAAYLAMLVFTFGMPQIVWLGYTKASVLAWLPALWLFSARLIRTGHWREVVWLALVMAAQLMGGHPEGSIYVQVAWGTFALYGLWVLARRKGQPVGRAVIQLAAAALLGVGLSAVQWLPGVETILQSHTFVTRNHFVFDPQTLFFRWQEWAGAITFVLPNFFGNPRLDTYWYPYSNFNEQNLFMGVTTVALALLALVGGRLPMPAAPASPQAFWHAPTFWQGPGAYFAGLGLVTLGLALSLPGFTLLAMTPGLHLVKAARWRGIVLPAVALVAAYGLDRYLYALAASHTPALRRWGWIWGVLGVGSVAGALLTWGIATTNRARILELAAAQIRAVQTNPTSVRTQEEYLSVIAQRLDQMIASFHPTTWTLYLPLALAVLWLVGPRLMGPRGRMVGMLIVGVVLVELWRVAYDYNPALPQAELLPTPPLIADLRAHAGPAPDPFRVVGINLALFPNTNMVFGLEDVRGYEPSGAQRYYALLARAEGASPFFPLLFFNHAQSPLLDFLNVRYAFSTEPLDAPWEAIATQTGGATLYFNPVALPRAFLVYQAQPARTPDESLALTLAPATDLRHSVILEVATDAEAAALAAHQPPVTRGSSTITHYAPGEITVEVDTPAEAFLVLSESYITGWRATLDGAPLPLYAANHAFHAVRVPAGRHTVTFTYAPTSVVVGAWVTLSCLGVLVALGVWPRRAPSRQPLPGQ